MSTMRRNRFIVAVVFVAVVMLIGTIVKFTLDYRNYRSFDYQYGKAFASCEKEDYSAAFNYIDRALELAPEDIPANILYAEILVEQDDSETAISLLQTFIQANPGNLELYGALIQIYEKNEMYDAIHHLLADCKEEAILNEFSDYVVFDPTTSVETGVYDAEQKLELFAESGTVYYTLDNSDPLEKGMVYEEPIILKEGVTEVNAVCINEKNIPSDVIYRKYTVVIKGPDAPVVTPDDGEYTEGTVITMEIPKGCKGYYAFDAEQVSTASQEYTGPVEMPEGSHVFYGILVAANGKESDIVSKSYTYNPGGVQEIE